MPEKIGKYQILERVGSGGMGMIYKAHDPMLDRVVALKVISTEIEVSEELRARFFREAQACARLSHPNIVTVYDMGEDTGRLFIVMEFLEGEDLRHVISRRKPLTLEEKLSVMLQVCDGLHYAHQKGVVHRDIKPGNVLLLRTGQAKILDFGIAQISNTDGGLTRTGLIMGTLRYVAPEQVRGRADHRSDIFSVGAVFYELLGSRPPFTGENPMRLLEQLRAEEPPPLSDLVPTISPALAAIIERALRKEPAERFGDLDQMRTQLEQIRRELVEEAQRVRALVNGQRAQLGELTSALATRLEQPQPEAVVLAVEERDSLETLQALERDLGERIETLKAQIARADSLEPVFRRGRDLLDAGSFADAAVEFEAILADLPWHAGALHGLAQSHALAEAQRCRELAAELVADARRALNAAEYTLCLEILGQIAEIPPPAEDAADLLALRQTAEAGLEMQAAIRRALQHAESTREQTAQARRSAQDAAAARYATALWNDAEARLVEAEAAFARDAHGEASQGFDAATAAYRRCREVALEARAREHEAAEHAREQVTQGRAHAEAANAAQYARELWEAAELKMAEAQAAVSEQALDLARRVFDEAFGLYTRAEETAREARQRERAERAHDQMLQARAAAQAEAAEEYASVPWREAEERGAEGAAAFARSAYEEAGSAFEAAVVAYRRSEEAGRAARQRAREVAAHAREEARQGRARAEAARARHYARELWSEAETRAAEGEAAFERGAYGSAGLAFAAAGDAYRRGEEAARETERRDREAVREASEQARQGRAGAERAGAAQYAPEVWGEAQARAAEGQAAVAQGAYREAGAAFAAAAAAYRRGEEAGLEAQQRARQQAERAGERASQARARAEAAHAAQYAQELWGQAEARTAEGEATFGRGAYEKAGSAFEAAVTVYRRSEETAREAGERAREAAERAADQARQERARAEGVRAAQYAQESWSEGEARTAEAEAQFGRGAYREAGAAFEAGAAAYRRGEEVAAEAQRRELELSERASEEARQGRAQAKEAGAAHYARGLWEAAEAKAAEAQAALDQRIPGLGVALFNEATHLYGHAGGDALEARQQERRGAEEARHRTAQGQRAAETAEAQEYAPALWSEASAKSTEGRTALAANQYAKASQVFDEALLLYREAEEQARGARRREREQAEQGREAMAARRRGALGADAASHAPDEWSEGEASAAKGEAAFAGGGYAEASRAFELGAALYREAEERAREIVRARESARAEAEKACQAVSLAREHAARVQAPRYAGEQWRTGENAETRATTALSSGDYAAALTLFAEARRSYTAATRTAGVGAEAEARRVTAMMRDAMGLFESGDIAACLRRVGEVLTLRPGDTAAERLRSHAEEKLRQVEAGRRPLSKEDGTEEGGTTVVGEAPRAGIAQPLLPGDVEALTVLEPEPSMAAAPEATPDATELSLLGEPTVHAEPPPFASAASSVHKAMVSGKVVVNEQLGPTSGGQEPAVQGLSRPGEERPADAVERRWSGTADRVVTPPPGPAPRHRPVPFRIVCIGLGTAAVVIGLIAYWSISLATRPATVAQSGTPRTPSGAPDAGQLEAEALRRRVATSREAAVSAGAERLAAATLRVAGERERAADNAVQRRDWSAARSQYDEALASYGAASGEAQKASVRAQREGETRRVREDVSAARRAAEAAGAPRSASTMWAKAGESSRAAEDAVKKEDLEKARSLFADSATAYREAEKQANDQKRVEAERAQRGMAEQKVQAAEKAAAAAVTGRRSAEQGAAARYAPADFAAAQKKEEEARRDVDRGEYENAASRFREASRGYQAALLEAQRLAAEAERQVTLARQRQQQEEAERQAALARQRQQQEEAERQAALARQRQQQEAEQATARRAAAEMRAKAQADHEEAVKAGADVYAKDVLAAAAAKEGEGERLAAGQDLVRATQAYRSAAERYVEAGRHAKVQREAKAGADQARTRMTTEKQRARPEAPDFGAAVAQERQAEQQYQRAAFKEAGEGFAAATTLFAKAVTRPPDRPSPRPSAADEVRSVLDTYVRAFETKDVALMQKVRPRLKADEVQRLRDSFEQSKEYRLALKVDSLEVSGEEAVVKGRRQDSLVSKTGQSFRNESTFTFHLKRGGDGWIIDAVR